MNVNLQALAEVQEILGRPYAEPPEGILPDYKLLADVMMLQRIQEAGLEMPFAIKLQIAWEDVLKYIPKSDHARISVSLLQIYFTQRGVFKRDFIATMVDKLSTAVPSDKHTEFMSYVNGHVEDGVKVFNKLYSAFKAAGVKP